MVRSSPTATVCTSQKSEAKLSFCNITKEAAMVFYLVWLRTVRVSERLEKLQYAAISQKIQRNLHNLSSFANCVSGRPSASGFKTSVLPSLLFSCSQYSFSPQLPWKSSDLSVCYTIIIPNLSVWDDPQASSLGRQSKEVRATRPVLEH